MAAASAALAMTAVSQASTAYQQSQALKAQGAYQRQVSEMNAASAEKMAQDALSRGSQAANRKRAEVDRLKGAQRAALAAQGIEIDSGSAAELLEDTTKMGELEALSINNNAWREAFGYKAAAQQATNQGRWAEISAKNQAKQTVLAGGMQALGTGVQAYGEYEKTRPLKAPKTTAPKPYDSDDRQS